MVTTDATREARRGRRGPDRSTPMVPPRLRTTTILPVEEGTGEPERLRSRYEVTAQRRCRPGSAAPASSGMRGRPVWAVRADPRQNGPMSTDGTYAEHPHTFAAP